MGNDKIARQQDVISGVLVYRICNFLGDAILRNKLSVDVELVGGLLLYFPFPADCRRVRGDKNVN